MCSGTATGANADRHVPVLLLVQVLLRWGIQSGCAVIPKSVHPGYIQQYAPDELLTWQLSAAHMVALDALEDGHKYCWDASGVV